MVSILIPSGGPESQGKLALSEWMETDMQPAENQALSAVILSASTVPP